MVEIKTFQRLLDSMDSGGLLFGSDRSLLYANRMIRVLVEAKSDELDQVSLAVFATNLFYPDGRPIPSEERPTSIAFNTKTEVRDVLAKFVSPSGQVYWLRGRSTPVLNEQGEIEVVITSLADVTEAEEARHRQEEMSKHEMEMIQNVAHEFRTPLTMIRGYTDILLAGDFGSLTSTQRECLEIVSGRAKSLQAMIDRALAILQAQEPLAVVSIQMGDLCLASVQDMKIAAGKRDLELIVRVETDWLLMGDEVLMRCAVENVLTNAVKFTEVGQVEVIITADDTHGYVIVRDTGIGIPANEISKIFDRFHQVDGRDIRAHGGTGIGLHVVKQVVERHGGYINVESVVGQGSTFRLCFPLAE